jgi:hypothetical protein
MVSHQVIPAKAGISVTFKWLKKNSEPRFRGMTRESISREYSAFYAFCTSTPIQPSPSYS